MDKDKIKEIIDKYKLANKQRCFALVGWKNLQARNYSLNEMLEAICIAADFSVKEMDNIIDHLTAKVKVFGRGQVQSNRVNGGVDLTRDSDGTLKVVNYEPTDKLPLKGQHHHENPSIFRKGDSQTKKNVQKSEERMHNLGELVRNLFPNADNEYITMAMRAIRDYASKKKINADRVVKRIERGTLELDDEVFRVVPKGQNESIKKGRTIVLNESDVQRLSDELEMSEYKFYSAIKHFIGQLLADPVNAQPSLLLKAHNLNRSVLLNNLLRNKIINKSESICDKDENGMPKAATMHVKFSCPKKDFDRKLQKLYIRFFEKNLPPRHHFSNEMELNEEGEGGAASGGATAATSSGAFITKMGDVQRRQIYNTGIEESTTTFNTGKYTYDAPVLGDEESLKRKNGENGSVSINKV